jgi:hypothetical protein
MGSRKTKLTTTALDAGQYLVVYPSVCNTPREKFCIGFIGRKRCRAIDGHYFTEDLTLFREDRPVRQRPSSCLLIDIIDTDDCDNILQNQNH